MSSSIFRWGRATVHGGHALKHELGAGAGPQAGGSARGCAWAPGACVTGRAALEERGAAEQGIQLAVAAARPVAEMRGAMKSTDDFISWRDEIQTAHSWFGLGGRAHQHLASDAGHVSFLAYVDEMRLLDQVVSPPTGE